MEDVNALFGMFDHCTVEAMAMRWRTCDMWKIVIAGLLLLLLLMVWVPLSAASAHEGTAGLATKASVTVQAIPTEDATVTALNKEKLTQEVQQLKEQNAPDLFGWLRTNATILLSTLVVVIGGLIGLFRWFGDRRSEREKRAEERFQSAAAGLGDEKESAKISAAILLRTFMHPGYEQFSTQAFDLTVAHLRLPRASDLPEASDTPLPPTTLSQGLVVVFKEAFPLARRLNKRNPQSLDATGLQLDHAYLGKADLKRAWLPQASLREAALGRASLREANLREADLRGANLSEADLRGANLSEAKLDEAILTRADLRRANLRWTKFSEMTLREAKLDGALLTGADLRRAGLRKVSLRRVDLREANLSETMLAGADLRRANLRKTDLSGANLRQVKLNGADLTGAKLNKADLRGADLRGVDLSNADLREADLRMARFGGTFFPKLYFRWAYFRRARLTNALFLEKTDLRSVKGLAKRQLEACQAKGAIIDEDHTTSTSQSTVVPSLPLQRDNAQTSSASFAQGSPPSSDTDGSSVASPRQDSES